MVVRSLRVGELHDIRGSLEGVEEGEEIRKRKDSWGGRHKIDRRPLVIILVRMAPDHLPHALELVFRGGEGKVRNARAHRQELEELTLEDGPGGRGEGTELRLESLL